MFCQALQQQLAVENDLELARKAFAAIPVSVKFLQVGGKRGNNWTRSKIRSPGSKFDDFALIVAQPPRPIGMGVKKLGGKRAMIGHVQSLFILL